MKTTMRNLLSVVLVCVLFLGLMTSAAIPAAAETELTEVSAWNLVLADEIAVNFYVSISDAAAEDAVMQVTDGCGTTAYPISQAEKTEDGQYVFTGYLAAAQMTDSITLQLISGDETGPVHSYCAAQYARYILAGDYSQSTQELVRAMLNYGAAAQLFFDYNTDDLANAGYEATETPDVPAASVSGLVSGSVSDISYYGATLLYDSRVAVRFYFDVSGQIESYTFAGENGESYTPVARNGRYYVDVPDINPQDYDKTVTLQVSDGTDTMTVSYSPMTYILRKYADTTNAELRDLVAYMYQYHNAAKAYLADNGQVSTDGNGIVTEQVVLQGNQSSAVVAAGTQLEENTTTLTLSATPMAQTGSDVVLSENEQMVSMDVHVEGVSKDNTVPVIVTLNELAPEFLNQGNITLYHVENGTTVEMTRVYSLEEVDAHNEYYYDITTGTVTVALASFSEIAVRSNSVNAWNGEYDYTWYDASATELTIANADQLAAFSAIVGGMDGQTQDSFDGKTVKLIADISIGDTDSENGLVFYPIGYYNSTGSYEKVSGGSVSSGFKTFCGTFDGQGHTVSDFYQNTWEMFGDYNDGYSGTPNHYRDGMGLFGKVYGGTVKNLTVKNFSSDGEFTTTGTVAAYADCRAAFENIAIFNCNPRVYNIGNGGIVGCIGWYATEATTEPVTFKNITVDNSNKISALWGSWDVACGGLVGQYYPTSGQTGSPTNGGVHFENCHVAAQIDVNNDVCANYQYYAYRYAGMMIGSVRENVEGEDGRIYPKMDGITAENCTVHYGTWNDYYYCELVANSLASYTHDHQMSRLEQVKSVEGTTVTPLEGEAFTVPSSGRYNYVVVDGEHATENAKCYHFVNGAVWNHTDAGKEDLDGDGVAETEIEDKQHLYLEFYDQLVTGYGWGVTSKGIADIQGVTVLDREVADSVEKFNAVDGAQTLLVSGSTVTVGDLFTAAADAGVEIDTDNVQVFVSPADDDSTAGGTYAADTTDWTKGTLTLSGAGNAVITITDYNYCVATTLNVTVKPGILNLECRYSTNNLIQVNTNLSATTPCVNFTTGDNGCGVIESGDQKIGWIGMENVNGTIVLTMHFNADFASGQSYTLARGSVFGFTDGSVYTLAADYVFTFGESGCSMEKVLPKISFTYRYGTEKLIQFNTDLPATTPLKDFLASDNGCQITQSGDQSVGYISMANADGTIVLTFNFNNVFTYGQSYTLAAGSVFSFTDGISYALDQDYTFYWNGQSWVTEQPYEQLTLEYSNGTSTLIQVNTNLPATTPIVNFTTDQNGCSIDQSGNTVQWVGWIGMANADGTIVLTFNFNSAFEAGQTYVLPKGAVFGFTDGNKYALDSDYTFTWDGSAWTMTTE